MIPIFAMTFIALLIGVLAAPIVLAQAETVPHGIAEWAAGVELWVIGGVVIMLAGVYGWLILYALANRERLVALEAWRDAVEKRLDSGKGSMDDIKGDVAMANARLNEILGGVSYLRGVLDAREKPAGSA